MLLLNWQDRENPEAGGAELHLHEVYGRLADRRHEVRAVVGGWPGAPRFARLDGIEVERVGGRYSYAARARRAAVRTVRSFAPDLVVEDINKIPLYSPLWAGVPVVALVPHLFGATAFAEARFPVAAAVWAAERAIPRVYRRCPFQAISESTALDLTKRGLLARDITVIPPGMDHGTYRPGTPRDRAEEPTLLYVGRLKRYKGLDILFDVLPRLRQRIPGVRLVIAGRGSDEARLRRLAARCSPGKSGKDVRLLGYVSEEEKVGWLRRAWAVVYPSPKEGWGMTNVEAAACGTPVVASDSQGLRESVDEGRSGLLARHGDVESWTQALLRVLGDPATRDRLGKGGIAHAARFSWSRAADETEAHLYHTIDNPDEDR
ncbi:glycosyltransferase family 4 protein [Candidatus Palauibacter sp.]|uniref:glycosyltransferase family 4 protein n=1 Tax=Candidatus Palauibacter sp. TaxID=3101350 RepID=UPI003AF2020A